MPQDRKLLLERVARIIASAERRRPTKERYELAWSSMLPYDESSIDHVGDVTSCVYEIWEQRGAGTTAVYIGETKDLERRLREHKGASEQNDNFKRANFDRLYFSYAEIGRHVARKMVERALWKLYQYEWNNENGPTGASTRGVVEIAEEFPEFYTINFNGARRVMKGVISPVLLP